MDGARSIRASVPWVCMSLAGAVAGCASVGAAGRGSGGGGAAAAGIVAADGRAAGHAHDSAAPDRARERPDGAAAASQVDAALAELSEERGEPSPADIRRARQLVRRGLGAYARGEYGPAEELLKQAMAVYPFLPQANLALGKILLIRGSAARDQGLINNARLMFEMARAIDPGLREAETLLELFKQGEISTGQLEDQDEP